MNQNNTKGIPAHASLWMPRTCGLIHLLFNYSGDHHCHGYCMILWCWGCPNGRTDPECPVHVGSPTPCLIIYSGDHNSHEYYGAKGVLMNECSVRMGSPTPWFIILTWSGITQGARNRWKQFSMVPQRFSHRLALLEMEHLGCSNAVPNCARTLLSTPEALHGAKPVLDDRVKFNQVLSSSLFHFELVGTWTGLCWISFRC